MKVIIAVPARLESKRLPNKLLEKIGGEPMIKKVLKRCKQAKNVDSIFLCSDNEKILRIASEIQINAIQTSSQCKSGSERISSVLSKMVNSETVYESTLIINVQGDQPFIDPSIINKMIKEFKSATPHPEVITPIYRLNSNKIHNPNVVKTLIAADKSVIYFSRSAIPFVTEVKKENWHEHATFWGHVGIYGYRADTLRKWNNLPYSCLENVEKLEQLRILEAGIKIKTFEVENESLSVDTYEQLQEARNIQFKLKKK